MSSVVSQMRILVVDDHPLLRGGVTALVNSQSDMSIVAQASNGREAIQQFRAQHPDVTLMDLQLPEMNGLDALIAIRGESPDDICRRCADPSRGQSRRTCLPAQKYSE
jgi:DNA-binding NarL/FixJ family response regulator